MKAAVVALLSVVALGCSQSPPPAAAPVDRETVTEVATERVTETVTEVVTSPPPPPQTAIPGPGMYRVGIDIQPGTYSSAGTQQGRTSCYWSINTGLPPNAEIIDNHLGDGPTFVTLAEGQVFETHGCQGWTRA